MVDDLCRWLWANVMAWAWARRWRAGLDCVCKGYCPGTLDCHQWGLGSR